MASFGKVGSLRQPDALEPNRWVRLLGNWQETSSRTPLWRQLAEALRLLILMVA